MTDPPRQRIRALHVDDDEAFVEMAATFLERTDELCVVTETSPSAALDRLAGDHHQIDCVVSDYEMSEMNGLDFLEQVRALDSSLPFILYTGNGSEEIASEAISTGVTDYLQKRDGTDQYAILANRITNAVRQTRAEHARQQAEARFQALTTNSSLVVLTIDETSTIEYANEAVEHVLGYSPDELRGSSLATIIPDRLEASHFEAIDQYVQTGQRTLNWSNVEVPALHADGHEVPVEISFGESRIDGQRFLTGVIRDITDRTRRKQELEARSAAMETVIDGIALLDEANEYTYVNQAYADVHGYDDPDVFVGETWQMCYPKDDLTVIETTVLPALESNGEWRGELTGKRRDGTQFAQEVAASRREDGGAVCVVRDTTDRQRAENRFRTLFEHLPDPAVTVELTEDDCITRTVNGAFEDVFGYPAEVVVDTSLNDRIVPPGYEEESTQLDQQARTGEQLVTEVRRQTVNGDVRDFLFRNVLIEGTEDGVRSHGIYTDITERKQRERRLNALHEATRELMAANTRQEIADIASKAADDVLKLPLNGIHLYDESANGLVPFTVSSTTRELIGDLPTFRQGDGIAWEVFESGESRVYADVRTAAAVHNTETSIRSGLYLPLGSHGIIIIGSTVVDDFDETDLSLAKVLAANVQAALDRSRREQEIRAREREVQRQNDRLEEFADVVAHDLRNPLTVAMGWLELAQETGDSEHFEAVSRAHERMECIVHDVLTLARQGNTVGETEPIALDTAARRAWENVETGEATLQVGAEGTVDADASRIGQLFENLFRNSVEHGGEGVTVRVGWLESGTGFYVEDTGHGIPPTERTHVFESGYTTESNGTGFGLAIVEEVTVAHGWEIEVTEGPEGGARFEIVTE